MAPFTAIFSQMIGGQRVSNALATMLCLAPLVGAATGTAIAPLCLRHADSAIMPVAALPAAHAPQTVIAATFAVPTVFGA